MACSRLLLPWTPHAVRLCLKHFKVSPFFDTFQPTIQAQDSLLCFQTLEALSRIDLGTELKENLKFLKVEKTKSINNTKFLFDQEDILWGQVNQFHQLLESFDFNLDTMRHGLHRLSHKLSHNVPTHAKTICSKQDAVQVNSEIRGTMLKNIITN
jgi:hypothetical protein